MVYFINIVIYSIIHIAFVHSLFHFSGVQDNYITITEKIIRDTANKLFTAFKVRDLGSESKLKHYSSLHHNFISITLKDSDNLKEIARLTRVKNLNKNTKNFIAQINAVLDEGNTVTNDLYLYEHLCNIYIKRLRHFNSVFKLKGHMNIKVNPKELTYYINNPVHEIRNFRRNTRRSSNRRPKNESSGEFWKNSVRRIYNGNRVHIKDYAFMASIHVYKQFQCAGSIIKSDLILTSASCLQLAWNNRFYRENPLFLSVRVGSDFAMMGGEEITVLEIEFQPQYNPTTLEHNLAVIRLSKHISFQSSQKVRKIDIDRIPRRLGEDYVGRVTIVGWGATDKLNIIQHPIANRLKYAQLDNYPLKECMQVYTKKYVTRTSFCAGFLSQGEGACDHDAGGPGIIGDILMGVISYGSVACGKPDSPTVFTKVGFYADWIDEIMDKEVPIIKNRITTKHTLVPTQVTTVWPTSKVRLMQPVEPNSPLRTRNKPVVGPSLDKFADYLESIVQTVNSNSLEKLMEHKSIGTTGVKASEGHKQLTKTTLSGKDKQQDTSESSSGELGESFDDFII